jgi:DNA-binding response OmpR family regulator
MPPEAEHILILDADAASNSALRQLLQSAGYDAVTSGSSTEASEIVKKGKLSLILQVGEPSDTACCDIMREVKGSAATADIRVILLIHGGPAERGQGLDLGADDVISLPWDSSELLARVRRQLRAKQKLDGLQQTTHLAEEGQEIAHTAFQAIAVTEKMEREASSLGRSLKIGVAALFVVALVFAVILTLYSRRTEKETRRQYAVVAQLERSMYNQQALLAQSRLARMEMEKGGGGQQTGSSQGLSDGPGSSATKTDSADVAALKKEVDDNADRLKRVENASQQAEGIIHSYVPSVCLLHVSVGFADHQSGRRLRYAGVGPAGEPLKDSGGNPVLVLDGNGPEVRTDFFGTGFLVGPDTILTNHHVVQPWWKNDELGAAAEQGLDGQIAEMTAYFPDATRGYAVEISKISDDADLAVVRGNFSELHRSPLMLNSQRGAAVSGQPLISAGYATGLSGILAKANDEVVSDILEATDGDPKRILAELARRKLIRPMVTQGHIGDVLADKITRKQPPAVPAARCSVPMER